MSTSWSTTSATSAGRPWVAATSSPCRDPQGRSVIPDTIPTSRRRRIHRARYAVGVDCLPVPGGFPLEDRACPDPAAHVQLLQDVRDVDAHRAGADPQL